MAVTLADVAREAGVSVSAVSRILSNDPRGRVSEATRARVTRIAADLKYRPHFAARALRSNRTYAAALVVPDLTNTVFAGLVRGIEEEALRRGYVLLLARAEAMQPGGDGLARLIGENRVDGLLLQPGDDVPPEAIGRLVEQEVPVVLINSAAELPGASTVTVGDEQAAGLAVRHLAELGHTRIGLLNGYPAAETARRRLAGFRAAMAGLGLDLATDAVTSLGYAVDDGRRALRQVLAGATSPTAVVVANINAAFGVLREARALGVRVPEQVSVVAVHDSPAADDTWPALTTVRLPLPEMGRQAMAVLDRQLSTGSLEARQLSEPPVLVRRESTAPPPT